MNRSVKTIAACSVSIIALASATFAQAQTAPASDSGSIEEIVVTARQRSENLKDVPAAVAALTAGTLKAAGVQRAGDFVAMVPGVSLVQAAEQGDAQVNIRGVNSARDAQSSFAFVVDGVQMANPASFNREFTDLRQIEIVKGPQGAVYGRNAAAGAIIVTTDKPNQTFQGSASLAVGNNNTITTKGRIAGPLGDKAAGSLSFDTRKTDGFYGNTRGQDGLDRYDGYNINGRVVAQVGDKTEIDLKARYGQLDAGSIAYNAVFALPNFAAAFSAPTFFEDVNSHNFLFQNNIDHKNHQDALELSAKFDHDLGFATLTGWALYSDIKNDLIADGTAASFGFFNSEPTCKASFAALAGKVPLPYPTYYGADLGGSFFGPYTPLTCDGYQYQRRDQSDTSAELRITSKAGERLRWLGGIYALNIDREVGVAAGIDSGGAPPSSLYVAAGKPYATEQLLWDNFKSNVTSIFGQAAYDIQPNLEGSLALRYDREDRKVSNLVPAAARSTYITPGKPLNPGLIAANGSFLTSIPDRSKTYDQVQPKVGLRWTVNDAWTVYTDWGVGFKSGGFNNQGSKATVDGYINTRRTAAGFNTVKITDDFDKEVSTAFEVGAKARLFDGRLTLDGTVYDTNVKDMQFFEFFVGPFGLLRVVSNIDRVKIQGAELGARFKATSDLTLEASGALTDSKIKKNAVRTDTVGNKSPYTPDYTYNLAVQYNHTFFSNYDLTARADVRTTGPTWFHVVQDQTAPTVFEYYYPNFARADYSRTQRDAFTTVDARVSVARGGLTVSAFGQNIFDEKYLSEVIPAPEFGGSFATPASGASYGVEVAVKF